MHVQHNGQASFIPTVTIRYYRVHKIRMHVAIGLSSLLSYTTILALVSPQAA